MVSSELVRDWLSTQGFKHTIDADGDVQFKYQGWTMWATTDEKDQQFLRIIMPGIYNVDDADRVKVLEIINAVNRDLKAVKGFLVENRVWLSIEQFVDTSPEIEDFIERCLDILVAAVNKFLEALKD